MNAKFPQKKGMSSVRNRMAKAILSLGIIGMSGLGILPITHALALNAVPEIYRLQDTPQPTDPLVTSSTFGLDFKTLYLLAQQRDPIYESARYNLEAVAQRVPQARAGLLPTVAANAGQSRNRGFYTFATNPETERKVQAWNWNLQLNQPLLRWQNWQSYNQAEAQLAQAEAQTEQAEQELILRLAQAYFEYNLADENLRVINAQIRAVELQRQAVQKSFAAGTKPIMDVYEAQARYDSGQAQRVLAQNDLTTKKINLEKIVGPLPAQTRSLSVTQALPLPEPLDLESWRQQAIDYSPVVRAQMAAMQAAEYEIKKNFAGHLPTLDLVGSINSNYSSGSNTTPSDYDSRIRSRQIGLQLSVPLFAGGGTDAKVKESVALHYKARADVENTKREISATAQQAYAGVLSGASAISALESAVISNQNSVTANQVGYRLGTRNNTDVLNAEQQLATAQRDLLKARYDMLLNGLKLKAAVGGLNEQVVNAINQLFIPSPAP